MTAWLDTLRGECARTSQRVTADRLGVSVSMVNQVLNGVYKADTRRLEIAVRGELMAETVTCPVLQEVSKRVCQDHQRRPFASTNPQRVALYRACRDGCPHSSISDGD